MHAGHGVCLAVLTGRRVVLVVVLELLGRRRLAKVKRERVEHVVLGVSKRRVLRDLLSRQI